MPGYGGYIPDEERLRKILQGHTRPPAEQIAFGTLFLALLLIVLLGFVIGGVTRTARHFRDLPAGPEGAP
jgi:hypothetical protein